MCRLLKGAVVAALLALVAACGNDEGFTDIQVPAAFIRSVNAIPDSPNLFVEIGTQTPQALAFGQSSGFVSSLADLPLSFDTYFSTRGEQTFLIRDESLLVGLDNEMTLVLAGSMEAPQLIRIENEPPTDIDFTTQLELQFAHVATDAPGPVTVTLIQGGATVTESTLEFGESSPLVLLDAGDDYTIEARDGSGALVWSSGTATLAAGSRPLVMLTDYFGPGPAELRGLRVTSEGSAPFPNETLPSALRVANMTATQGPLDVTVRGSLFATNLPFQNVSDFTDTDAGEIDISIAPFGDSSNVLFESDGFALLPGSFVTLISTTTSENEVTARLFGNDRRRIPSRARLNVSNASPGQGTVDIYVVEAGDSISDFNPRVRLTAVPDASASGNILVEEGSYDFYVTDDGTRDVLVGPLGLDLMNGGLYSIYVTDPAGGGAPPEVLLGGDFTP